MPLVRDYHLRSERLELLLLKKKNVCLIVFIEFEILFSNHCFLVTTIFTSQEGIFTELDNCLISLLLCEHYENS